MSRILTTEAIDNETNLHLDMNPELSHHAVKTIETLCERGCKEVNHLIDDARSGRKIETLRDFSEAETDMIIAELVEIMAVYDKDES